jgi:hypothetical protein
MRRFFCFRCFEGFISEGVSSKGSGHVLEKKANEKR